jgi:hypothetical protein
LPLAFVLLSLAEREKRSDINIINQHKVALPSFLPSFFRSLSLSLSLSVRPLNLTFDVFCHHHYMNLSQIEVDYQWMLSLFDLLKNPVFFF